LIARALGKGKKGKKKRAGIGAPIREPVQSDTRGELTRKRGGKKKIIAEIPLPRKERKREKKEINSPGCLPRTTRKRERRKKRKK